MKYTYRTAAPSMTFGELAEFVAKCQENNVHHASRVLTRTRLSGNVLEVTVDADRPVPDLPAELRK